MRTVDLLGKELTLRGFRPKILAFESGRRPAPCTLAARAWLASHPQKKLIDDPYGD